MNATRAAPADGVTVTLVGGPAGTTIDADHDDHAEAPIEFTDRAWHE